jgi:hypothetical protein
MKASEWIDRVKTAKGWNSDYRVAKELEFNSSTISMYRTHGGPMDENIAIKVAHVLGEKPEVVILDQCAERVKDPAARSALFDVSRRLSILCKVPETYAIQFIAACAHATSAARLFS